jgi:hypothetical protein
MTVKGTGGDAGRKRVLYCISFKRKWWVQLFSLDCPSSMAPTFFHNPFGLTWMEHFINGRDMWFSQRYWRRYLHNTVSIGEWLLTFRNTLDLRLQGSCASPSQWCGDNRLQNFTCNDRLPRTEWIPSSSFQCVSRYRKDITGWRFTVCKLLTLNRTLTKTLTKHRDRC